MRGAICGMIFVAVACGPRAATTESQSNSELGQGSPTLQRTPGAKVTAPTIPSPAAQEPLFGPVVAIQSGEAHCNAIVVDSESVLFPSHCKGTGGVRFPFHPSTVVVSLNSAASSLDGVEALVLAKIRRSLLAPAQPITGLAYAHPEVMPSAARLALVYSNPTSDARLDCLVVAYSPRGLVEYDCQSLPGQSGALVLDRAGAPFAIHLGRRNGLGYAVLLATVRPRLALQPPKSGDSK